jgi:hypothetical protein
MTPVPATSPAPQAAATAPAHGSPALAHGAQASRAQVHGAQVSPWVPSGRVRTRRDRQPAARCLTGPDQARASRAGRPRRGAVESP